MQDVMIVAAARSPIGKRGGSLARVHPADILGPVQMEVVRRGCVDAVDVGQVVGGCINKVGVQAMNITRTAWLACGGPQEVPAVTVDSQCGSSQYAIDVAQNLIRSGQEDIVLACGVENMSRLPIGSDGKAGAAAGMGRAVPESYYGYRDFVNQFEGAERMATKYGITREDADQFGLESQRNALRAQSEGSLEEQLIPLDYAVRDEEHALTGEAATFWADENPRETSREALAKLKPVAREDGLHTAGTSSQIADGAAAVLLMSATAAAERDITPLARVAASTLVGCDPVLMLEGPIPATRRLLKDTGLTIDDIDTFEINEAFASVVLAWARALEPDAARVNPNGGAIALGHPLGATGCILVTKAVHELERTGGRYGLISMCCGGGLGTGTVVERVD
jgi:acetyl-CoA C-acetyltransferase